MKTRREISVHHAFTLIELLVVIGIIALLASIGLAVGVAVTQSSRAAATKNTVQVMETYLSDLDATGEDKRSYKSFETDINGSTYEFPIFDGRESGLGSSRRDDPAISSIGRFLAAGDQYVGDSSDRFGGLDGTQLRDNTIATAGAEQIRGAELIDQWGNPIRAVHPAFDGGFGAYWDGTSSTARVQYSDSFQNGGSTSVLRFNRSYRRFDPSNSGDNIGDADEGICPNERVYFYSAGPDGDPGTRADNVYGSVSPRFPNETRDF